MRTTVDIDPALLERAKRLALGEQRTLSALVNEALVAYLSSRRLSAKDSAFELITRGKAGSPFPSPAILADLQDEEDAAPLAGRGAKRRAAS